jgi:PAS domain S-box-containing protein
MCNEVVRPDCEWLKDASASESSSSRMFTSESYHRSFWNLLEHGVVLVDENKNIIEANPYFVQMIGISAAELVGMHISDIIDTGYWRADNVNMNAIIRGVQSSYSSDEELIQQQGRRTELIPVRVIVTRVPSTLTDQFQHFIVQIYKIEKVIQINGQPFVNQNEQSYGNIFKNLLMQPWFIKTALWVICILVLMLTLSGNLMPVLEKIMN